MMSAMYKVKTIDFLRRDVPIVLQNENGPCPLLALANTLLLRNAIYLSPNTPEVSQERLVSLIAGHLLDANSEERLASHGLEYRANLQQNVEDAMALLPKLTTGVDVNVRFDSIRGFEFTRETAIFDLLDIRLVHGWLIDPQDGMTEAAVGQQSYNELVALLVNTLGDDTPTHLLTPTAIAAHSREASFSGRASRTAALSPSVGRCGGSVSVQASPEPEAAGLQLDSLDDQDLRQALELSMDTASPGDENAMEATAASSSAALHPPSTPPGHAPVNAAIATAAAPNLELDRSVAGEAPREIGAALSPTPPLVGRDAQGAAVSRETPSQEDTGTLATHAEIESSAQTAAPGGTTSSNDVSAAAQGCHSQSQTAMDDFAASSSGTKNPDVVNPRRFLDDTVQEYDDIALAKGKMPAFVDVDPDQFYDRQQGEQGQQAVEEKQESATSAEASPSDSSTLEQQAAVQAKQLQQASIVQTFLETTSSQLTEHGLLSLHQGLRSNELAILFRNNHLNTIFSRDNAIWVLVTDQGYLFESNVVWERLSDVSGNTEFARADFSLFSGQPSGKDVAAAADLAQAAFASVVPPQGFPDSAARADPDADMALAMQLQEQEEYERQSARQQARAADTLQPSPRPGQQKQQRPSAAEAGGKPQQSRTKPTAAKPVKTKGRCSIM